LICVFSWYCVYTLFQVVHCYARRMIVGRSTGSPPSGRGAAARASTESTSRCPTSPPGYRPPSTPRRKSASGATADHTLRSTSPSADQLMTAFCQTKRDRKTGFYGSRKRGRCKKSGPLLSFNPYPPPPFPDIQTLFIQ